MAKSLYEYRQDEQKRRENALRNYMTESASSVNKEGAKASSGFNLGDYFADFNQYTRAGGLIGGLAGLTKPLWYDKLSDEGRQRLDNYVDGSTFLSRKLSEGAMKSIEGVVDVGLQATPLYMIAAAANDDVRDSIKDFVERGFVGEWYDRDAYKHREDALLKDDGNAAQLAEGVGGMLPSVVVALATGGGSLAAKGASKLPQVLSLLTTATGAAGNATESAYKDGADYYSGLAYGAAIGGLEAATEKLVGGAFKGIQGAGLLDDIIPVGNWAKTGIGRYAANAVGEGVEEMTSEALAPHAKVIYKGKDAYADYDLGDHIKDIGKAGLMGAAISGIYGGAFDAIGGGVKQGDIQNVISDMESIREQSDKLKVKNNFTAEYGKKADSQTLGDLRIIEKTLKGVDENKRADLINKNGLSGLFETDGSLKADYAEALSKESEFDRRYFDEEYRAHESVIKSDLAELNSELEDRFGENAKKVSVYSGELTQKGKAAYTKLQRAQKIFNELSGRHNGIIVTDESPNFNGKLVGDSRIYIPADTLESGAWAGTLVHENMHFAEGTEEYNRLVSLLEADTELEAKAVEAVMNKSGYGFDKATLDIIGKRISAGENVEQGARLAYELYRSEINAHMGEAMLGTEAFINRVVRTDAPLAEKIIGKILDLKEAFGRIGDPEAQAQHKRLAKAEKMYLNAIEAAGKKYLNGKIVSADDEDEEKEKTAQGGGKYSFAGEHAKTADKLKLENAKQLLANGVDSEVIRKETGWFKGYDGKWRFEIDDSSMTVTIPKGNHVTVGDIVKHQKLFEAYPDLKDIWVTFHDLENARGSYSRMFGDIELSKKLLENPQELKSVISHELQHAIQDKEGFSKGASVEYWERKLVEGYDSRQAYIKAEEKALLDQIKAMRYEDKEFVWDMEELLKQRPNHPRGAINWDTLEKIEEDSPQWKYFDKERDSLSKTYGDGRVSNFLTISRRLEQMKHTAERDALQLYYETAGEIEARDVQERLHLDVTERKNIRPDIDQEDVVFADNSAVAKDFVGWTVDNNEVYVSSRQIMSMSDADRKKRFFKAFANTFRRRTAKFTRNGHVYYAQFDNSNLGKLTYEGKDTSSKSSDSGYKAKIRMLADGNFFELVEDTPYKKTEAESGKNKKAHKKAKHWDYYVKTIIVDGKAYDVMVNIRIDVENNNYSKKEEYVYSIRFRDNKTVATSLFHPASSKATRQFDAATNNIISQNSEKSTPKGQFSFKEDSDNNKKSTSHTKATNEKLSAKERKLVERLDKAEKKAKEERQKREDTERYSKTANRVLKLVRDINNWKKGVFESAAEANGDVFKGIIGELSKIDIRGNVSPIAARKAMKKLADWYGAADIYPIVKDLKEGSIKLWDEAAFSAMVAVGDAKAIEEQRPLTVADVKNVELVIRHLKHITEVYHKAFKNGDYVTADELATNYLRTFRENANVNVGRVKKLIDSKYYEYFGDAEALMKWHDRYAEGGFFTETFNELREGALKMAIAQMEMRAELDAWLDKNHNFLKNITNKTIEVEGVEMTRAEALSLYMTARREHAEGGLAVGGFEVRGGKDGRKNSVDGLVEKEYLEAGKYDLEKLQGVLGKFQRDLYSKFTESEKTYLGFVEKILNEDCKLRKERTDNIRLGYSNTIEEFYYPIRRANVAKEVGKTDDTLGAELGRIRKLSFNQNTVIGSKGKLLIEPINNVVDRHIAGIAMYENISIAIDNFNLVFNYDVSGNKNNPESIAKYVESNKDRDGTAIENSWANGGEYIDKLIKDIEGINTADKYEAKALAFIRSGFAKFQLGANPKTWVTQLSSLFAASSMLDPKYMAQAMVSKTSDKAFGAELDKYSPLAKLRNSENTSALAEGVMDKISGFGDVLMKPIGMTDRFVIKKLWYACQLQVEAEQKIKFGTEENKTAAAKLLENVIFETQQNSLLTERSAAMRSNSELIKGLTMFSSDAMKVTARIVDAYGRVCVISDKLKRAEGDAKKALETERADAIKEFKRATGAAASTAIFMSLVALAFSHLYGKRDDDETLGEKAKTFGADFAGNLIGGLPLVRDIYSLITDGYELNHYALSAVSDLVTGINGLFTLSGSLLSGKDVSLQDITSKTKAALFGVGQIFGIPLRNMYNVGRGVFGLGGWLTGNGKSFGYTWDSVFYDKSYQSDLNKAIAAGDDKLAARIASLMVGESFDGVDKAVSKEIRTLAEGGHIALPRAVGDSITYDGEEYRFTLRQRNRFERIYGTADEVLADLVKLKQYRDADDEVKAKAIKYVYDVYYNLAIDDMLGVDSSEKNVLFAEAIDIEKLAIIVAQARMFTADTGKDGTAISGSKKRKVINYIESLSLTAAQKYMIFGYLGYSNTNGESQVKAYINRLKLTGSEKKTLLKYSGYAA